MLYEQVSVEDYECKQCGGKLHTEYAKFEATDYEINYGSIYSVYMCLTCNNLHINSNYMDDALSDSINKAIQDNTNTPCMINNITRIPQNANVGNLELIKAITEMKDTMKELVNMNKDLVYKLTEDPMHQVKKIVNNFNLE